MVLLLNVTSSVGSTLKPREASRWFAIRWPPYGFNRINLVPSAKRRVGSQLPPRAVPWSPSEDDCSTSVAASLRLIVIGSIPQLNGLQTLLDNQIKALKPWTNTMKRHFSASFPDFFISKYSLSQFRLETFKFPSKIGSLRIYDHKFS